MKTLPRVDFCGSFGGKLAVFGDMISLGEFGGISTRHLAEIKGEICYWQKLTYFGGKILPYSLFYMKFNNFCENLPISAEIRQISLNNKNQPSSKKITRTYAGFSQEFYIFCRSWVEFRQGSCMATG